jgi:lipopolysaccharide heptosyltransferase I
MGDIIHGIPVASALRARFPDAEIDWLVDPRYVELLEMVPALTRRIAIDPRGSLSALLRTIRELRHTRYDAVFDLQGLIKSAVLARFAGGVQTIGLSWPHLREKAAVLFYTRTVNPGDARHVIAKNLSLLHVVGAGTAPFEVELTVPETSVARDIEARFRDVGFALLNPGAAWPNKRWPAERFGAIAAMLRARFGLPSMVLWGPGEHAVATAVVEASGGAAVLSPPTTIADLFALTKRARLVVSGDTGPLHIASAVGTPVVALFGPTYPERNGPWSRADVTVSRADVCVCHYERRCRRSEPCIETISIDEVVDAIDRRMAAHG